TARAAIPPATIFLRLAFIGVLLLGSSGGSRPRSAAGVEGRGVVRARAEREREGVRLARADVGDDDRVARLLAADRGRDVAGAVDREAAELRDHVAAAESRLRGRGARADALDAGAGGRRRVAEADAHVRVLHGLAGDELR